MAYNPTGSGNTHIDKALTNLSLKYENNTMMAEELFPVVNVSKRSDLYYIHGREGWRLEDDLHAPGAHTPKDPGLAVTTDNYYAERRARAMGIDEDEAQAVDSPLEPRIDATETVTDQLMLQRERRAQLLATAAANYNGSNVVTLAGTSQWNDYANSDPIGDIRDGVRQIHSQLFREPNKLLIPYTVMSFLSDHPDFLERIKYSERAIFNPELLSAIFGIQRVVVPQSGFNSAAFGETENFDYLWGKDVVLAYVTERPRIKTLSYGYEFMWKNQVVDGWPDRDRRVDYVRITRYYVHKAVTVDDAGLFNSGYLIKDAVA